MSLNAKQVSSSKTISAGISRSAIFSKRVFSAIWGLIVLGPLIIVNQPQYNVFVQPNPFRSGNDLNIGDTEWNDEWLQPVVSRFLIGNDPVVGRC